VKVSILRYLGNNTILLELAVVSDMSFQCLCSWAQGYPGVALTTLIRNATEVSNELHYSSTFVVSGVRCATYEENTERKQGEGEELC
jgi:hypothetical protein